MLEKLGDDTPRNERCEHNVACDERAQRARLPSRQGEGSEHREAEAVEEAVELDRKDARAWILGRRGGRLQRRHDRDEISPLLDVAHDVAEAQSQHRFGQQPDRPDEDAGGQIPDGEGRREPCGDTEHERAERAVARRADRRHASTADGAARGSVRTQSSQITSTSSMMSACQTYWWAKSNASALHWPR